MTGRITRSQIWLLGEDAGLERHRITSLPESMFYIPDFITQEEEAHILDHVCTTIHNTGSAAKGIQISPNKWVSLSHRRLQALPARLTASNTLVSNTGLPDWLSKPVSDLFDRLGIFRESPHGRANHCLINEYLPGQGIMPHEDGAAYYPVVATVSLAGTLVLDIYEKSSRDASSGEEAGESRLQKPWRILQEPRSLLVTTGSAYTETLHGIAEVREDVDLNEATVANWGLLGAGRESVLESGGKNERTARISLTFRDVLKVSKLGSTIFGKPKG